MTPPTTPDRSRPPVRLIVVTVLAGAAATVAGLVGAVSLVRIAQDFLGFPPGLYWTLTGSVDIGAAAGAVLWVTTTGVNRRRGVRLNVACSAVSAIGVGLDHATHAVGPVWPWVAFGIGAFLPALSTWLIHVLAHLVTEPIAAPTAQPAAAPTAQPAPEPAPEPDENDTVEEAEEDTPVVRELSAVDETPEEARRRIDRERKREQRARARARERAG